jgi:hypothetical protein
MIKQFTSWLLELIVKLFSNVWDFVADAAISVFDLLLSAISGLIGAIPAPDFLTSSSLAGLINQLPPYVLYYVGQLKITECLAILSAGFLFRMVRKAVTLGQW